VLTSTRLVWLPARARDRATGWYRAQFAVSGLRVEELADEGRRLRLRTGVGERSLLARGGDVAQLARIAADLGLRP
jgi:hypothetical protein